MTARYAVPTLVATAVLVVAMDTAAQNCSTESRRTESLSIGGTSFEVVGPPVELDPVDLVTRLRWTVGLFFLGVVSDEVAIHIYKPTNSSDFDNWQDPLTVLFIVCHTSESGSYSARLLAPTGSAGSDGSNGGQTLNLDDGHFIGSTLPIPVLNDDGVLRARLRSFPGWQQKYLDGLSGFSGPLQ